MCRDNASAINGLLGVGIALQHLTARRGGKARRKTNSKWPEAFSKGGFFGPRRGEEGRGVEKDPILRALFAAPSEFS